MKNSLNHAYRLVWNEATGTYVAVAETTRARGKRASGAVRCAAAALVLGLAGQAASALDAGTLPTGATVAAGAATLTQNGNSLNVNQQTQKLVINWNSFDIGSAAGVHFSQPSSNAIALNRINSGVPTQVQGSLTANGNVWILNSAGVVFGKTAQVNVGGLVASSLNLSDSDFLSGHYTFTSNGQAGAVTNAGQLQAGGVVALVAPVVRNSGSIQGSSVALAAGDQVTLDFSGDGLLGFTVDRSTLNALVENTGSLQGSNVTLSARSASTAMATVVNNEGVIEATGLSTSGGRIVLDGGATGEVHVAGSLDASSATAQGGRITVTGQQITLDGGATLNASGATGGGTVLVGGGYQGKDSSLHNATTVTADSSVKASASATDTGNGGQVVFWSDDTTRFAGRIDVRGGANGGDGGQAEVSGKQSLSYSGVTDARADKGNTGELLLDPATVTITAGAGTGDITGSTVYVSDLEAQLANVTLQATGNINFANLALNGGDGRLSMANNVSLRLEAGTTGNGSITFANAQNTVEVFGTGSIYLQAGSTGTGYLTNIANLIAWGTGTNPGTLPTHSVTAVGSGTPGAGSVTLYGADGVTVGGSVTTHGGYVRIWADSDNASGGGLTLSAPVTTNGGNLYLSAGTGDIVLDSSMTLGAGRLFFKADGSYTTGVRVLSGVLSASGDVAVDTPFTMNAGASILTDGIITLSSIVNLNTGTGVLTLRGSAIDFTGATLNNLSTASIRLEPANANTSMVLGDNTGFASVSQLSLLQGIKNLTIGREDGTGTITLANNFSFAANGALELVNKNIDISAGTLTNTAGNIILSGDNINVARTVTANGGAGSVTLRQEGAGTDLHLGTTLASSSTSAVNAATLIVGRADGGDVIFDGDITTNASSVHVIAGGKVEGINGGVSAANLAVTAAGGATLTSSTFDFTTLALNVGGNTLVQTGSSSWGLGTVDGVNGLTISTTTPTTVNLVAQNSMGLNAGIQLGGGDSTLNLKALSFDAGTATVSGQALATVSFDTVNPSQTLTVGGATSMLSQTSLSKFNGSQDIVIGSAGRTLSAEGALAATVGHELTLVGDTMTLPYAITANTGSLRLNVLNGGLSLNAPLTAGNTVILQTAGGDINGSAVVTASKLAIEAGTGDVSLSGMQQVSTLAAQAGSLALVNGKSLTVGTADGVNGITVDKTVDVRLSGATSDLTLAQAVHATNSGNETTGILLASGRNFTNNAGAAALQSDAGRWLVYSTTPTADVRGGLSPDFKQYQATTASTVLGTGNGLLYTVAPTVTVSLVGTTSKVYDGTTAATLGAGNYTISGVIDGDTVTYSVAGAGVYGNKNVGTAKSVSVDGVSMTGASNGGTVVYGYTLGSTTATGNIGTITPRSISAATGSVQDKVYDGTTTGTLGTVSLSGVLAGDVVGVSGSGSATFADKNAGTGKAVTISGLSLSGTDAGNYAFDTSATASITPKAIGAATGSVNSKVYDGTTAATLGTVSLSGVVAGDSVSVGGTGSASFVDKNAGSAKAAVITGMSLGGADAANYVFNGSATAAITPKSVSAAAGSVQDKVYDGTTKATVGTISLSGVVAGDTVGVGAVGSASFSDKNVGSGKAVTVNGVVLNGTDAGNYAFDTSATASITPRAVGVSADVATKVYDGSTAATLNSVTLSNVVAGDELAANGSASFANKNAGTGKTVNLDLQLSGADAGNYMLPSGAVTSTGTVTAKVISAGPVTVTTKLYDGSTVALVSGGELSGVVAGDKVGTVLKGSYDNAAVGVSKTVTVGLGLNGSDAGNYQLDKTQTSSVGAINANPATGALDGLVAKVDTSNGTKGSDGTGSTGNGGGGGQGGTGATLLPGTAGTNELFAGGGTGSGTGGGSGAGNGAGTGTGGDASAGSSSGSGSGDNGGNGSNGSNGSGTNKGAGNTSSGTTGNGDGSAAGQGDGAGQGGVGTASTVQLSTEGEFRTADGVSVSTVSGNGGGLVAGDASNGAGSGANGGNGGNTGNGGGANGAGNGNGNSAGNGSSSGAGNGNIGSADGAGSSSGASSTSSNGNGSGNGKAATGGGSTASETVLPIFVAEGESSLSFQGQYRVVDQGSSLSLQRQDGQQAGQPTLKGSVSVRTQAVLPLDGGERAVMQLTLMEDGTLVALVPDSLAGMSRDTLSAYALSALKAATGSKVTQVRSVVLRFTPAK
ncbi:YDG domain-containing protein [Roseateles depolymerans]|uniref:Uncharacterized protein n=1 Tax=Roseateles depolymerans TaxID=76731 RepID=A0A0U3N8U8_9BURK|nr:YDG domain-containing protein [Roseateles depolymerans]ALV04976.1 hypothetical protein RD2015_475 [Roseateles depolymerans]REG15011.1 filamentous hemagglutinin family protein [Roseateles depolymerans]